MATINVSNQSQLNAALPAELDRMRLQTGLAADITIFDPATVGSGNRPERRYDLPGGAKRMVMPSRGIRHTIVNGQSVFVEGALTGEHPGQVLRG